MAFMLDGKKTKNGVDGEEHGVKTELELLRELRRACEAYFQNSQAPLAAIDRALKPLRENYPEVDHACRTGDELAKQTECDAELKRCDALGVDAP